MHKITFAQRGVAGITHTALVSMEQYDSWMRYAMGRDHIVIVDRIV